MVAGYVDAVGEGVTKVNVGDRVVSGTKVWTSKGDPKYGGLQRFCTVEEEEVIEVSFPHSSLLSIFLVHEGERI